MGKIASGSLAGYALVFLLTPVLTRVYMPSELGQFAVFGTLMLLLLPLLTLSNEFGVVNERRLGEARRYVLRSLMLSLVAVAVASVIATAATWIFGPSSAGLPTWAHAAVPLAAAIAAWGAIAVNWRIRCGQYGLVAGSAFVNLSSRSVLQVALGYGGAGLKGLVAGEILGRLFAWWVADRSLFWRPRILTQLASTLNSRLVSKYSLYVTPKMLIENLIVWLPAFAFSVLYGPFVGGLVAVAQRFGSTPATIYNQSVGAVLHRLLVVQRPRSALTVLGFVLPNWVCLLALFLLIRWGLAVRGEELSGVLLGDGWTSVGPVMLFMLPLYFVQLGAVLTDRVLLAYGLLRQKLVIYLVHVATMVGAIAYAWSAAYDWLDAIALLAYASTGSYLLAALFTLAWLPVKNRAKV